MEFHTLAAAVSRFTWLVLGALLLGLILLALAWWLARNKKGGDFSRHFVRELGMALVVAAVVSRIFEYSTRKIETHEKERAVVARTLAQYLPSGALGQIEAQMFHRRAFRTNVLIHVRVSYEAPPLKGAPASAPMPPAQAVLWMSYSYDLSSLAGDDLPLEVEHELDHVMRNESLDLPRFERLIVARPGAVVKKYDEDDDSLKEVYDGRKVRLTGKNIVLLPADGRVNIRTERYELVNIPGSYYLIMPEVAVTSGESGEGPSVKVVIEEVPPGVEALVTTYYKPNDFTRADASTWVLNKTILPGQGLTIVFRKK